jgi:hypothetical protein
MTKILTLFLLFPLLHALADEGKLAVGNGLSPNPDPGVERLLLSNNDQLILDTNISTDATLRPNESWASLRTSLPFAALYPLNDPNFSKLPTTELLAQGIKWNKKLAEKARNLLKTDIQTLTEKNDVSTDDIITALKTGNNTYPNIEEDYKIYLACIYWNNILEEKFKKAYNPQTPPLNPE